MNPTDKELLDAIACIRAHLLSTRVDAEHWEGRLAPSALATATALFALHLHDPAAHRRTVQAGRAWLSTHANPDGSWGDTPLSAGNLSATLLAWAALNATASTDDTVPIAAAENWIRTTTGSLAPADLAAAVTRRYGADRTFAVPILTMACVAGALGPQPRAWSFVPPLPFEVVLVPRRLYAFFRLQVVSYALPALLGLGLARFRRGPLPAPLLRLLRHRAARRALELLPVLQPAGGGFLEAIPLTAFTTLGLLAAGERAHPVVGKAIPFLLRTQRADGSWPIDTHLGTWLTALAFRALAGAAPGGVPVLPPAEAQAMVEWLLRQQARTVHPFTGAAPGGWGWTHLPGGVPDADDTAAVLLALRAAGPADDRRRAAVARGLEWLFGLQNRDGGIPTFCRGWQKLPFDRSAPDLTAHAVQAAVAWQSELSAARQAACTRFLARAVGYLRCSQRPDGSWVPLWFGNAAAPAEENPVYGTSRVVLGLAALRGSEREKDVAAAAVRGVEWLLRAQSGDGGWGGAAGVSPSIEETALAVEALAAGRHLHPAAGPAAQRGARWLLERTHAGTEMPASPIGLYFARLWYYEELYPWLFSLSALQAAAEHARSRG